MRGTTGALVVLAIGAATLARDAAAAPAAPKRERTDTHQNELRFHATDDAARRLLQSPDSREKRRGVARATALESSASAALLAELVEPGGAARSDPRLALDAARALCRVTDVERARNALIALVSIPGSGKNAPRTVRPRPVRDDDDDDDDGDSELGSDDPALENRGGDDDRWDLVRRTAALAVARTGEEKALGNLLQAARGGGAGAAAARSGLYAFPPAAPLLGPATSVPIGLGGASPEFLAWLPSLGDLRVLDVLWSSTRANDVNVRAAGLVALARSGDLRVLPELRRIGTKDSPTALRIASAEGLTILRAKEAPPLVATLLDDDATADVGLRLLPMAPSDAGVRRAAARAKTPVGSIELRRRSVDALGRTDDALAVRLLLGLVAEDLFEHEVSLAIARSPSSAAMPALEALAGSVALTVPEPRRSARVRVALRAYAVRLFERGERSRILDGLAEALGRNSDVFKTVALARERVPAYYVLPETEPALLGLARAAGAEAPAAIEVYVAGVPETKLGDAERWLESPVESARIAAARGLAKSREPKAGGLLAAAYDNEAVLLVRSILVSGLVRHRDDGAVVTVALEKAALCDPHGPIRDAARRALKGLSPLPPPARGTATLIHDAAHGPRTGSRGGAVVDAAGNVIPFRFDQDGYAVVLGLARGPADVRLAL